MVKAHKSSQINPMVRGSVRLKTVAPGKNKRIDNTTSHIFKRIGGRNCICTTIRTFEFKSEHSSLNFLVQYFSVIKK